LSHLGKLAVVGRRQLAIIFELSPGCFELLPFCEQVLDRGVLAHGFARALSIVEKARIGNIAFQLLETLPFTRDEGLKIHKQKRRLRNHPESPFVRRNQLSFFGNSASRFRAAVAAGEFFNTAGGVDKLLFAGEKRMAGRANADLNVPTRRAGMVDRAACADNIRLAVFRMNVRFHGGKRARTLVAAGAFCKW